MISKKYRLREHEVSRVFRKGRPVFGKYWTLNVLEGRGKNHRMAVSISRKHDKRAVMRNKYRRTLYDVMKPLLTSVTNSEKETPKNVLQCVFTLKKGLKLDDVVPQTWIDDAHDILKKCQK